MFWGADRHIRRGGSGVEWSGDACVALAGRERRTREGDEGDASVRGDIIENLPVKAPVGYDHEFSQNKSDSRTSTDGR